MLSASLLIKLRMTMPVSHAWRCPMWCHEHLARGIKSHLCLFEMHLLTQRKLTQIGDACLP